MICQTSGIVLAINALTPFDASTCILIPSAALCAVGQLDILQDPDQPLGTREDAPTPFYNPLWLNFRLLQRLSRNRLVTHS